MAAAAGRKGKMEADEHTSGESQLIQDGRLATRNSDYLEKVPMTALITPKM